VPGPAAGPASNRAFGRGALAAASRSDSTGPFWYATCKGHDRGPDNESSLVIMSESAMHRESNIIERVENFVRHPVYAGSDRAMDFVLDDLRSLERSGRIGQATYRSLREKILRSPHIVPGRSSPSPRA
jgi:hypothetical protein